jgi:DNA-binding IclR family transcriptional regulator
VDAAAHPRSTVVLVVRQVIADAAQRRAPRREPVNVAGRATRYRASNGTADRALRVLGLFDEGRPAITSADVAAELGVARSTAYRYLKGLVEAGFLAREPGGGLTVGPRVIALAEIGRRSVGIGSLALPAMRSLRDATGETVLLTRRVGTRVVCAERVEAQARVRISYERGATLPLHAGAAALVLLAWEPEATARRLLAAAPLERFTPRTEIDVERLLARLREIRAAGVARSLAELDDDITGIAAPVRDAAGSVVAAIGIAALTRRTSAAGLARMQDALLGATGDVERALS